MGAMSRRLLGPSACNRERTEGWRRAFAFQGLGRVPGLQRILSVAHLERKALKESEAPLPHRPTRGSIVSREASQLTFVLPHLLGRQESRDIFFCFPMRKRSVAFLTTQ